MDWIEFESHDICRAKYENGTLYISFSQGDTYAYYDVPSAIFQELVLAEDKRAFLNAHIRWQFRYQKQLFD